ncbi:integrase core domain-containing protein [Saccharothrix stipae]
MLAVIEYANRRIRVLGATPNPTASRVTQAARNLVMDLEDASSSARFLIRDRDGKYPALFDAVLADAGIQVVLSGIRIPRMNPIIERWIHSCRRELLDRTLIWNQQHLLHVLREYEHFYNTHRPHQGIANARPLQPLPQPATDQATLTHLDIADGNDWAASSTSITTPPDPHGRHSRQEHGRHRQALAHRSVPAVRVLGVASRAAQPWRPLHAVALTGLARARTRTGRRTHPLPH